jgi:chromatin assembly factor 1 subunit B
MVRSVTFEIHWHNMEPIYACSFQPVSHSQLRRVLDHNAAQGEAARRYLVC